jgi:glycine/D-amino acid oxidase-like deaminating enzyme
VIGTSTSCYLSKTGAKVFLLESGSLGDGRAVTRGGFVIMQSKTSGAHLQMALASEKLYRIPPDAKGMA